MSGLGDVLRGLGSVLNPQVAQEVAADDRQQDAIRQQVGMTLLANQLAANTPEGQAKLEALKNERSYRQELSSLGDNPSLGAVAKIATKYGKPEVAASMFKAQEDRAARLQTASDNLEMRKLQMEQTHELALQRITDTQARQAETERHNRALEELNAQNSSLNSEFKRLSLDLQRAKLDQVGDQQLNKQVQQLGKAIEGAKLNDSNAVLQNVESRISKNPALLEYVSGAKSALPDWSVPTDIAMGRQAISKLFNIELKNRSGAAVTVPEYERLKDEYGKGVFKTPAQIKGAIEQARNLLNQHYRSVAAGFSPDVLKTYNENLGGIGGMPVIQPGEATPKVVDFGSLK
jgi:hypothetical protein